MRNGTRSNQKLMGDEIKPKINGRFTEVATIGAIDMKSGGGRPSNNDEKHAVFGHPVKFLRHPSDHIGNNLLINL